MRNLRIGIDLGTSYSSVGIYRNYKIEIIPNEDGKLITPSFVSINNDERLVGEQAKIQGELNPCNTIFDIKKLLGNNKNTKNYEKRLPFNITREHKKTKINIMSENALQLFSPEQILSMILMKLKHNAEKYLDRNVNKAVISVPVYFNESQRQAIKIAGRISGFNDIRLINESTAAALAYRCNIINFNDKRNVLIFDMGGGTLDVSVVTICENEIIVKGVCGDQNLGGSDFDHKILSYLVKELNTKYGINVYKNTRVLCSLLASCERAKHSLSDVNTTQIKTDGILDKDCNISLTREKFEELNTDLFERIMNVVSLAVKNSKINKSNIQDLVLVGGSSKIPKIQKLIQKHFGDKQLFKGLNANEAIVLGASIQAYNLDIRSELIRMRIKDITPFSLEMEIHGNKRKLLVKNNEQIPIRHYVLTETSEDFQTSCSIPVYENNGDRILYRIGEIPIKPAGEKVVIGIHFKLDSDGILKISAVDHFNNKINYVIKQPSDRLTENEIQDMIKDAEFYKRKEEELNSNYKNYWKRENLNEIKLL